MASGAETRWPVPALNGARAHTSESNSSLRKYSLKKKKKTAAEIYERRERAAERALVVL